MQLNIQLISLVFVIGCGIIVAKDDSKKIDENIKNTNSSILKNVNSSEIFMEGGSAHKQIESENTPEEPKKSVKPRKGVSFDNTKTSINEIDHPAQSSNSTSTSTTTVQTNSSSSSPPLTDQSNKTLSSLHPAAVTTKPSSNSTTSSSTSSTTTSSTSTTTTTTTTQKPIRKPLITYSSDDYEAIRESEKNIKPINAASKEKEKDKEKPSEEVVPKLEQDVDRTVLDEKRERKNYMIYLFLAVIVPLSFVAINLAYKRVKNYLELREYTRVDFLVDGMYVN